ncbi:glycosyltransferase [Desulfobulbus elongatus]|uniref:glycosyltransferase n=1 Tax=Desulfobulbus elongatus TaxID=53332 RepID=UPI000488620E|nr:glycosyltransferase [Desulfobulbus elongatus]
MNPSALHVYRTYFPDPPGGMQEAIRQVCLATKAQGIANTIYTLSPYPNPPVIERPEGRIVRSRSWAAPASCDLGGPDALTTFRHLAAQADLLHFFHPWPFADVLRLLAGRKTPAVLTYVSDVVRQRWLGRVYAPLMWQTLRAMRVIVANCPAYAQTSPVLSDPAIRDKVRIVPLGIVEESYPAEGDATIFSRLGLAADEPFFLFIGVLRYYKGLHTLIEAARQVRALVVIAGSGPEGEKLRSFARDKAADNVLFAGQVTDAEKVALIKRCQAMVLPSHLRSEAYGMVLVEAAIFGRPLISCEIGTGTSFVNAHEESGYVVPPEHPAALAEAMNALLRDAALAESLGRGARARYEQLFSGPALGRAYADLFREVAGCN